jgi:hypothetical protein
VNLDQRHQTTQAEREARRDERIERRSERRPPPVVGDVPREEDAAAASRDLEVILPARTIGTAIGVTTTATIGTSTATITGRCSGLAFTTTHSAGAIGPIRSGGVCGRAITAAARWLSDPWMYRLPPAYAGTRWIRYYNDALLVDTWTGEVFDVIYDFFW